MNEDKEHFGIYVPEYKINDRPFFVTLQNGFEEPDESYTPLYLHYSDDEGEFVWRDTLQKSWPTDINVFTDTIINDFNFTKEEKNLFTNFRVNAWEHLEFLRTNFTQEMDEIKPFLKPGEDIRDTQQYKKLKFVFEEMNNLKQLYFDNK